MIRNVLVGILVLFSLVVIPRTFFVVQEGKQAMVLQFGKIVGKPIVDSGLNFKWFFQDVIIKEKRLLNWDGTPRPMTTKDKKFIEVDTTARLKIVDYKVFLEKLTDYSGARSKADTIIDSETRNTISRFNLIEVVRNNNKIIDVLKNSEENQGGKGIPVEKIETGRDKIGEIIYNNSKKQLLEFGLELVDFQFKRVEYDQNIKQKIYERMISERKKIAQSIRSLGDEEARKIEGTISKELQEIESEAYKRSQKIKGDADRQVIKIYADAYNTDPEFYEFIKTMDIYKDRLKGDTKLILSGDNKIFKNLK